MKYFLFLIGIALHNVAAASPNNYIGAMRLKHKSETLGLVELGVRGNVEGIGFLSGSLMAFDFGEKTYEGINMSYGLSFGRYSKVYLVAGGFLGKYEDCDDEKTIETEDGQEIKRCVYDFTGGFYPEVGVELDLMGLRLGSYARYYKTFEERNDEHFLVGFSVGWALY